MKKFFQVLIGFVVIVFVIYKCASCILDMKLENAEADFMEGIWVGKDAKSEKIDGFEFVTVYAICLSFNKNNSLGYSLFEYDSDLNIPQNEMHNSWLLNIEEAIEMSIDQNNKNTWEIKNGKLILTINGKKYKPNHRVKKDGTFIVKFALEDIYDKKTKFKVNFLKFMDKEGNKMDYSNNPITSHMEDWIINGTTIF